MSDLFREIADDVERIDAPSVSGRILQASVLAVKACSILWRRLSAEEREALGPFPEFTRRIMVESLQDTPWATRPIQAMMLLRASVTMAKDVGPYALLED